PVVEKIVIEEGITTVAQYSFRNYLAVTEIYLPDSVNTVYKYAFAGDKALTYVEFGDGLESCSTVAFDELTFMNGTTKLKQAAKNFVGKTFVGLGDTTLYRQD
ncbi:MAG: leucine-rich repeat domain-containing protein, partial [archaeon]|nr:leucine-rich repeat domain-containing protein [archaeon]